MTRTRVCLIGAGRAGAVHALNLHHHAAGAEIVAVVDGDLERGRELGGQVGATAFATLDQALAVGSLDAAVIATPTYTHRELAVSALNAGLHVFCEKPMALTPHDCDEMIDAAQTA